MKDLLKKWLSGGATWEEEKQLRRAGKQDDFLAEALEGYHNFPNQDHTATIERLKGQLPPYKQEEKGLVFYFVRVAAAAAIVGVIGTFFWVQNDLQQPDILSQNAEKLILSDPVPEADEVIIITETTDNQSSSENNLSNSESPKTKKPKTPVTKPLASNAPANPKPPEKEQANLPESEPTNIAQEEIVTTEMDEAINDVELLEEMPNVKPTVENLPAESKIAFREELPTAPTAEPIPNSTLGASRAMKSKARKKESPPKINYYVGAVKNEDGQPLNEVNIIGLNSPFETESELSGDFILKSDTPLTRIAVTRDGFHTRKININQYTDFLNVVLLKKSTKINNEADNLEMVTIAPKPDGGFKEFYYYVKENLQFPPGTKEKGVERDVEIRFFIDENGTPTNLKIVNPDNYDFDKEAIRLLENGPKWQPFNSHAKYYISFELE